MPAVYITVVICVGCGAIVALIVHKFKMDGTPEDRVIIDNRAKHPGECPENQKNGRD
jgi:hypothetical protein